MRKDGDILGPVLRYPGAKWKMADWIIRHFPPHQVYLEPFFGSGAVFFNKRPSGVETINDLDGNIVNLFRVIRKYPEELARLIEFTPWSREEYQSSYKQTGDPLEDARRFLVRCWQAYGTDLHRKTGWNNSKRASLRVSRNNDFLKLPQTILDITERLKSAQIENRDALKLIREYNYPEVLIYADPPYLIQTRTAGKRYKNEMTTEEHEELLEVLRKHKGPVIISGYKSDLYDRVLAEWVLDTVKTNAMNGKKRFECIWINPVTAEYNRQYSLFDSL